MPSFSRSFDSNTTYSGADMVATFTIRGSKHHKNVVRVLGELQTLSYSLHMQRGSVRNLGNINAIDFTNGPRTIAGSLVFIVFDRHVMRDVMKDMQVKEKNEILPDEMPEFDITVSFANEYGRKSVLRIYGIRLINEGKVMSMNDMFVENTYQYVAKNIETLKPSDEDFDTLHLQINQTVNTPPKDNVSNIIEPLLDSKLEQPDKNNTPPKIPPKITFSIKNKNVTFDIDKKTKNEKLFIYQDGFGIPKYVFDIPIDKWPFTTQLENGFYIAKLEQGKEHLFKIEYSNLATPILFEINAQKVKGRTQNALATTVCYRLVGIKDFVSEPIVNQLFELNHLSCAATYELYVKNSLDKSAIIQFTTKPLSIPSHFDDFSTFLANNNLLSDDIVSALEQAKKSKKDFLEAFYDLFKASNISETMMHIASYYDLCLKEASSNFIFENKWLGIILKPEGGSRFLIYNDLNQTYFCSEEAEGYLTYTLANMHNIALTTYKPRTKLYEEKQRDYLKKRQIFEKEDMLFCQRSEGALPVTSYFDTTLFSAGAYISVEDHVIYGHGDFDMIVVKEDIYIPVAFKYKEKSINLSQQPFFVANKHYYIYLEKEGKSVSKCYSTLFAYVHQNLYMLAPSLDKQIQESIYVALEQKLDFFQTFNFAFSHLINQHISYSSSDYKQLTNLLYKLVFAFDKVFYTLPKEEAFYTIIDGVIIFEEQMTVLIFDKSGNLREKNTCLKINKPESGYIIYFNATKKASVIDFNY